MKRKLSEKIEEIRSGTIVFPYANTENNQIHSREGTYKKHSNRNSVAYDVRFLMVNMKGMCCTRLQCTLSLAPSTGDPATCF